MIDLILWAFLFLVSIFFLSKSADWTADSVVALTHKLNTTKIALGILLVSLLYILPELLVSLFAITQGENEIAFGNIIGSNIGNIAFMIGLSTLFATLVVHRRMIVRDGIFLMVATIATFAFMLDGVVSQTEGIVLLALAVFYIINVYEQEKIEAPEERKTETEEIVIRIELLTRLTGRHYEIKNPYLSFTLGILVSLIAADVLVLSVVNIASIFGVSELVLGMTVVALGTSLADIATAVAAARKGHGDLAVAGCLGANIFTLLIVMGLTTLINPLHVSNESLWLNGSVFLITATLFFGYMITMKIGKVKGIILLLTYAIFLALTIITQV
jgi:cation:H+ antiporter